MKSRDTISAVMSSLETLMSPRAVTTTKIANQEVHVVGDTVVHMDAQGKYLRPDTPLEALRHLLQKLKLSPDQNIDAKSVDNGTTLLIEATLENLPDLVVVLLNHGADPSVCDNDNNNAIMHASKKTNSLILKEFIALIKKDDKQKQHKEAAIEVKVDGEPASTKLNKMEQQAQALTAPVNHSRKSDEPNNARIVLSSDVLSQKNNKGETAASIVKLYLATNTPKSVRGAKPHSFQARTRDELSEFEHSVHMLQQLNPQNTAMKPLKPIKSEESKVEKPPVMQTTDNTYAEKLHRVNNTYTMFLTNKIQTLAPKYFAFAKLSSDVVRASKREKIRMDLVAQGNTQTASIPPNLMPTIFPIHPQDSATAKSVLALLKDYYAPERAPLKSSMGMHRLRRFFTLHTGRRYCKEAEELYHELSKLPLTFVGIMSLHQTITKKFEELRSRSHDKKNVNDIFNSSFTRRLFVMREYLEHTIVYDTVNNKMTKEQYIDRLDTQYKMAGLLNAK